MNRGVEGFKGSDPLNVRFIESRFTSDAGVDLAGPQQNLRFFLLRNKCVPFLSSLFILPLRGCKLLRRGMSGRFTGDRRGWSARIRSMKMPCTTSVSTCRARVSASAFLVKVFETGRVPRRRICACHLPPRLRIDAICHLRRCDEGVTAGRDGCRRSPLQRANTLKKRWIIGAPDRIRTCDFWLRRPTLYPAELRARDVRRRIEGLA